MKFVQSVLNLLFVAASCSAFVAPHAKRAGLFGLETTTGRARDSSSCRWSAVAEAPTDVASGEATEQKIRNVAVIGEFLNDL